MELLAQSRINAIARDKDIGAHALAHFSSAHLLETDGRPVLILLRADAFAIRHHRILAEAFLCSLIQDHVQAAAMDAHLGKGISGKFSTLFAVDQLAETVKEAAIAIFDAGLEQGITQTEGTE